MKIGYPKRKGSYSNHPFSGALAVSFREGTVISFLFYHSIWCILVYSCNFSACFCACCSNLCNIPGLNADNLMNAVLFQKIHVGSEIYSEWPPAAPLGCHFSPACRSQLHPASPRGGVLGEFLHQWVRDLHQWMHTNDERSGLSDFLFLPPSLVEISLV